MGMTVLQFSQMSSIVAVWDSAVESVQMSLILAKGALEGSNSSGLGPQYGSSKANAKFSLEVPERLTFKPDSEYKYIPEIQ